jgi:deoxyribodipyrimidine photo-lyase
MSTDMRRDFTDREDLIAYLKAQFPDAVARDDHITNTVGGRRAAEKRLSQVTPGREYRKTRNYVDGAVSRLSPYIRYGVLNLAEVRDYALEIAANASEVEKFINELGWRDYWQRKYQQIGDDIWEDQEPYKTGFGSHQYADKLPDDIRYGQTGIAFIDDFAHELIETGYLHNHARMWMAAYVVHWRMVKWQAGARWFLEHLLDGDPASNNLSWQWVASTFSHKPYYYNLDNVLKYAGERYEGDSADYGHEPFVGSYDEIARDLFPNATFYQNSKNKKRRR